MRTLANGASLDQIDFIDQRAADWAWTGKNREMLELLKKPDDGGEAGARKHIVEAAVKMKAPAKSRRVEVLINEEEPPKEWQAALKPVTALDEKSERDTVIEVEWKQVSDTEYTWRFSVRDFRGGFSGGGGKDRLVSEFGYWFPVDARFWDS